MSARAKRLTLRWLAVGVALLALIGGAVAVADPDESGPAGQPSTARAQHSPVTVIGSASSARSTAAGSSTGACGSAGASTAAAVDMRVARRIYVGEVHSREVRADIAHITGSLELTSALSASDAQAVHRAVYSIVYAPHWHIVRLRVSKNGRVLADVGGPDIVAPVSGALTVNGRKLGSYTMSVQDDVGYVKLVSRFIGVPIDLYGTPRPPGSFLMGTLKPAPTNVSDGTIVQSGGVTYLTRVLVVNAFPKGKLRAALFVPIPTSAQAARSCQAVRLAAWGNVARHIAARFTPLSTDYQAFVGTLQGSTASPAYVRVGNRQIAGLNSGPRRIPRHGTVRYRGATWQVFSWSPNPPARIYFLTPAT